MRLQLRNEDTEVLHIEASNEITPEMIKTIKRAFKDTLPINLKVDRLKNYFGFEANFVSGLNITFQTSLTDLTETDKLNINEIILILS